MNFLIAPDKFKGCLTAVEAAESIASGVRRASASAEIELCPIADGGEGTVAALLAAKGGRFIKRRVTGPLPEMKVDAHFAMLGDGTTAVIEMSAASGLTLLPITERNPLSTTSFGTGELIVAAVHEGAKKIILGLGGSATVDAGLGCAQACGFSILTADGVPTSASEPLCGRDLANVLMVKRGRGEITSGIPIVAAADVRIPLLGPRGAAKSFGPQKGASPSQIEQLENALRAFVERNASTRSAQTPGAGAAGGLGFAVIEFFNGQIVDGFELVALALDLADKIGQSDLCITGEGCLDSQTFEGKSVAGIGNLCHLHRIPCIALCGSFDVRPEQLVQYGITSCFCICDRPMDLAASVADVKRLLAQSAENCARLIVSSREQ